MLRIFARYAGARMHSPGLLSLVVTRKLSVLLFKSSYGGFDDIISGKGETDSLDDSWTRSKLANGASTGLGFIMLLSGEPGVGKTLTAESG
jgi:hypothetical protein